jgi:amino acid adenylation domain-containing protein
MVRVADSGSSPTSLPGTVLEQQLAYWKQQLSGAPAALELPTDFPRTAVQIHRRVTAELELRAELTPALESLGSQEGVTPFMTLLAAFQVLLSRLSGQEDVSVGAPIAGQNRMNGEGQRGSFQSILVLRTNLSGNPTFQELLKRVQDVTLGAHAHRDLPFEKLVEELHPPRLVDRHPFCEVLLNYIGDSEQQNGWPGVDGQSRNVDDPQSKILMTLSARPAQRLQLMLTYCQELFTPERMRLFLAQFAAVLEQAVANPQLPLDAFSLLTQECRGILPDPTIALDEPAFPPVTRLLRDWAENTPEQIAVSQGERNWTYREVQQLSERVAQDLQACGVRAGDVVALHGTRSLGTIVGMLGILSSGGVLLTVDVDLPIGRKALLLAEAAPKIVIGTGPHPWLDTWSCEHPDVLRIDLDPQTAAVVHATPDSQTRGALADPQGSDAAYIFFTSGTTGIPKGIVGCHKGLSHFLNWQRAEFAIGPDDRVAQLTSLSFDVVLRDIFLPLTSGGTLCLPESGETADGSRIFSWLQRERISVLHAVPSLAGFWLDNSASDCALPALRRVFFAGEPLSDLLIGRWRKAVSNNCEIVNLYGPTETTLAKCYYRVPVDPRPGVQPLGRPLPQTQALVLSESSRLCVIGETGQIVLRTPFRTLRFLRPTTTRGFQKNPFRDDERDRFYFTGDRGRYRPDGELEILGRLDDQVKIHGVRVEPGEISAILTGHAAVRTCFVLPLPGKDMQLAAYVVLKEHAAISVAELRSYLAERFPITVAAVSFTVLDRLPLTANGKVDRKALPAPELQGETYKAPRNAIEKRLAAIWEKVFENRQIGMDDNFFELGGHSLTAVRLFAGIEAEFGRRIPLQILFRAPTIATLATTLSGKDLLTEPAPLIATAKRDVNQTERRPFFWIGGVEIRDGSLGTNQSIVRISLFPALYETQQMESVAERLAQRIMSVQPRGPYMIGGFCYTGVVAIEVARQLVLAGGKVELLTIVDPWHPFLSKSLGRRLVKRLLVSIFHPESLLHWFRFRWFKFRSRMLIRSRGKRKAVRVTQDVKPVESRQPVGSNGDRKPNPVGPNPESNALRNLKLSYQDLTKKSLENYIMRPYQGNVTLIVADRTTRRYFTRAEWSNYALGGVEVRRVHAPSGTALGRTDDTAAEIRECIERLQH